MLGQGLSVGSDIKPPQKASEIESQFSFVAREEERLGKDIASLASRLSPILRQESEKGLGEEKEEGLTPLASGIRKIGKSMSFFAGQIESILERLEL